MGGDKLVVVVVVVVVTSLLIQIVRVGFFLLRIIIFRATATGLPLLFVNVIDIDRVLTIGILENVREEFTRLMSIFEHVRWCLRVLAIW